MLTGILIGAGNRGADVYAEALRARPALGRIVGIAEPRAQRRNDVADRLGLAEDARHADWRRLLDAPRRADFAIVATPDALHVEPALAAIERGYAVLLEKPMAPDEAGCEALVAAVERSGGLLQVCHVLRHAPLYAELKRVVDAGALGEIVTIQHSENVSFWHYAHSYVRGHWRNVASSAPMILTKSCHDMDLLHWIAGAAPQRLTSLARPTHLHSGRAPEGAPERCIDGCPHAVECPYDAVALYRDLSPLLLDVALRTGMDRAAPEPVPTVAAGSWRAWPVDVITDDLSAEGIERALRSSRYGRCVYRIEDHDQPSSQNVDVLFANGVNASFTMHSSSYREGRETRIDGTRASLRAGFYLAEQWLELCDHKSGAVRRLPLPRAESGHGGADHRLLEAFLAAVRGETEATSTASEALWSHRMAFAADRAARCGEVIEFAPASS